MPSLFVDVLGEPAWMWIVFLTIVLVLLTFDLGFLHRRPHEIGVRESLGLSAFYIVVALMFGGWVWWSLGKQAGLEYLTGFVVEKSLAMDNIFVIAMIFSYFNIPRIHQHRVLVFGILGVVFLRGIMIGAGAELVRNFEWILYIFAAFLVFTGVKICFASDAPYDVGSNPVLRFMRRHLRISSRLHGQAFFVREQHPVTGRFVRRATPLFVALVLVELADVVFAVDSIPAIFAITTNTYIVYTSNIFAILGLRALYFALAATMHRFAYVKYAVALVLVFVGGKVIVAGLLGIEKVPAAVSLVTTVAILLAGIGVSFVKTRRQQTAGRPAGSDERP